MLASALAAATTLLSVAFALSTLERWADRRRPHHLAWTVSLVLFAGASAAQWAGAAMGWGPISFRLFYLLGPILSVPFLALGTIYLLAERQRADRWAATISLLGAFGAGVVLVAPLRGVIDPGQLPQGSDVFGAAPRVIAAVASGAGATVLIGGAVVSIVRVVRRRGSSRLVTANALIALGTVALSAAGLLNSVVDEMVAFSIAHVVGITLVFAGFLATNAPRTAALRAVRPPASAQRSA